MSVSYSLQGMTGPSAVSTLTGMSNVKVPYVMFYNNFLVSDSPIYSILYASFPNNLHFRWKKFQTIQQCLCFCFLTVQCYIFYATNQDSTLRWAARPFPMVWRPFMTTFCLFMDCGVNIIRGFGWFHFCSIMISIEQLSVYTVMLISHCEKKVLSYL